MLGILCLAATAASASVQLRVGARPDTLQRCESGHLAFALWNDDAEPLRVRVFATLAHEDSVQIGPRQLRARLGPHELRTREFDFMVPQGLAAGRYELRMLAVASDSSHSEARVRFVVEDAGCSDGDTPPAAPSVFLDALAEGTGLDFATPNLRSTWGSVRRRYDSTR
jgi:hypothetical protein